MSHCEPLRDPDTGQVIASVHVDECLSDEARAAMVDLVAVAKAYHESRPDRAEMDARQDAARERIRARTARLRATSVTAEETPA